jgi:hypothetical protein
VCADDAAQKSNPSKGGHFHMVLAENARPLETLRFLVARQIDFSGCRAVAAK